MVDPKDIDFYSLGFNFIETKSMFVSDFKDDKWDKGKLVPFGNIEISPAACVLNYGQGIFEGMKALRTKSGEITLFKPQENGKRFNYSARRLLLPEYNVDEFIKIIKTVVKANEEFIPPYDSGGALYIRPMLFGSGPMLGVSSAHEFKLIIFTAPVGPYFPEGFKGIDLLISKKYTRAAPGGTGSTKTICNYAGTMLPAKEAKSKGFAQILYLDAVNLEFIEEVGAANFFGLINGKLVTPRKTGTILEGITRESVLEIASKKLGIEIEERDISYKELFEDNCTEVFCSGTAAVITPIASVSLESQKRVFNNREPGEITKQIYKLLKGIQYLDLEDEFGWITKV
ncbi:MAG: branched-chain amino acid aminotransferase [Promethearchaeota archaeon]|jgi:branched-chain amino acid aminotransferase